MVTPTVFRNPLLALLAGTLLTLSGGSDLRARGPAGDDEKAPLTGKEKALLERAREAARAEEKIQSVTATGTYEHQVQKPNDKEPQLQTRARVQMYFDRGKYHLRLKYEKRLSTITTRDEEKGTTVVETIDTKPEDFVTIYDGKAAYCVEFAKRHLPAGCLIQIFDRPRDCWGIPWGDPAHLGQEFIHFDNLLKNLERSTLVASKRADGGIRLTHPLGNSPRVRLETDVLPDSDANIVQHRTFDGQTEKPSLVQTIIWKKAAGLWYVQSITDEQRHGTLGKPEKLTRSTLQFDEFEINKIVDSQLFTLECLQILPGARTLDRRRPQNRAPK